MAESSPREFDAVPFERLIAQRREALIGIANAVVRDPHEAEDIVQETIAAVWQRLPTIAPDGMVCGVLMLLGSPFFVLAFHETVDSVGKPDLWKTMFPDWLAATMLCIGMVGGVLTIVLSVLFGLLIPSRVTRQAMPVDTNLPDTKRIE